MDNKFLTVDELAVILRCTPEHVRTMAAQGMPHSRLGTGERSSFRFREADVMTWLALHGKPAEALETQPLKTERGKHGKEAAGE